MWEIVEGDCIKVMAGMEPGSVRLAFAVPPYNLGVDYGHGPRADRLGSKEYLGRCWTWMEAAARLLAPDGSMWTLIDPRWAGAFQCMLGDIGLHWRETIIWHESFGVHCETKFGRDHRPILRFTKDEKRQVFHPDREPSARQLVYNDKRANPAGRVPSNVWKISRVCGTFRERIPEFPTQLPMELLRRIIRTASDPGDLVLDPFSGSASTGIVAITEGRRYTGIEISRRFVTLSRQRVEDAVAKSGSVGASATTAVTA